MDAVISPPECPHLGVLYEGLARLVIAFAENLYGPSASIILGKPLYVSAVRSGNKCSMLYDVPVRAAGDDLDVMLRVTLVADFRGALI